MCVTEGGAKFVFVTVSHETVRFIIIAVICARNNIRATVVNALFALKAVELCYKWPMYQTSHVAHVNRCTMRVIYRHLSSEKMSSVYDGKTYRISVVSRSNCTTSGVLRPELFLKDGRSLIFK